MRVRFKEGASNLKESSGNLGLRSSSRSFSFFSLASLFRSEKMSVSPVLDSSYSFFLVVLLRARPLATPLSIELEASFSVNISFKSTAFSASP